ncbi:pentapeptide repeat-containing protein [Arsenophonus endosymbiont of Bemisia tabaci]|uniref:pentapeptide repeat-containing protein n=1 Tax=Arsenophonus endosymbiont of Bemisia tabaci TaxID=536059 RepID=UPI0015F526AB|nr:pentapeptide repeat-containing protein [Arsenophonus endosymbiont of Bemisia tabaci]CAA2929606.1 hypothetical protein ARSQ2_00707 [Arsenophonus endosymbiont of Bemisia tabaci Q2]
MELIWQAANLSQSNLTHANLTGANLANTNLTDANLTNVDLSNIDLHSAILEKLDINNTNFAGASLNNTLTLALPNNWRARNLETKLNHFNYQGTLLTSIASIHDRYNELKIKLAWQLISSLKASNVDLKEVTLPLLNIFIKTPFSTDKNISTFVNQLMSEQKKQSIKYAKDIGTTSWHG